MKKWNKVMFRVFLVNFSSTYMKIKYIIFLIIFIFIKNSKYKKKGRMCESFYFQAY